MRRPPTMHLYRDADGLYRYRIIGGNGENFQPSSQGYSRAWNRKAGIRAAAMAFGAFIDASDIPNRGKSVRLVAAGYTEIDEVGYRLLLPAHLTTADGVLLIIVNED